VSIEHPTRKLRWAVVAVLAATLGVVIWFIFFTSQGGRLREDPHQFGQDAQAWVARHGVWAPLIFVLVYIAAALCLLPVWWLQVIAGYGFGIAWGIAWSIVGATAASAAGATVCRVIASDWFHEKVEAKRAKLRDIDERLGHNGFLVVMATRLMHFVPFGPANYLFGLTRISLRDVMLGTLLGNIPAIAFYVAAGAGINPIRNWRFMAALAAVNVLLLVPVALRYWKPDWFKRIGVE
jgi:uncharacterized membrane protein YdjX (TVP38/TMEM64 family)